MRLLFITTDEYPFFGTSSNLINKLVFEGNLKNNNQIGVLSLCNQYSQCQKENKDEIRIYRTTSFFALKGDAFWTVLKKKKLFQRIVPFVIKSFGWIYEVSGSCSRLIRPENVIKLKKSVEELADKEFDYVIPISGNYDAVVAVLLAKIKAKKIFWQVDPCSTNLVRIKRELIFSRLLEKRILRDFDLVLTDDIYFDELVDLYGESLCRNIQVFKLPLIQCPKEKNILSLKNDNDEINCIFSGLIYLGIRDPKYTIKLFNKLGETLNIKLHLYGPEQSDVPYKCSNNIVVHGRIDKEKMDEVIRTADFLINIGNKMVNQIPSKIYEYISSGLPIVNICKNPNCPTIRILSNYPNSINIFEDEDLFESQLLELRNFITSHRGVKINNEIIQKNYKEYIPRNCSANFLEIIKDSFLL